mmetsp:Transcript_19767/g.47156  ORF Transcript_19767/g.47156 Transcript_19767/m.47156 type:complete len:230 (+) Transcript_19767:5400-6089(+)
MPTVADESMARSVYSADPLANLMPRSPMSRLLSTNPLAADLCSLAVTMEKESSITLLPDVSCNSTTGCTKKVWPRKTPKGCVVIIRMAAGPRTTVKGALSTGNKAGEENLRTTPEVLVSTERSVNCATPFCASIELVPPRVTASPAKSKAVAKMEANEPTPVTVLPPESTTLTRGCGVNSKPADPLVGFVELTRRSLSEPTNDSWKTNGENEDDCSKRLLEDVRFVKSL